MTRLYLTQPLNAGEIIELTKDQRHYLEKVLRFESGQHFFGFNETDGEWKIVFDKPLYKCIDQARPSLPSKPSWLAFAPLKNDPMGFLIEKATELGVTDFQPILSERTNSHRLNIERLAKNAQEAAQQCERLDVPKVHSPLSLTDFLNKLPKAIHWYAALERSDGGISDIPNRFQDLGRRSSSEDRSVQTVHEDRRCDDQRTQGLKDEGYIKFPAGFIIGPEGGWSPQERSILEKHVTSISLGKNILRAETAAIVCLSASIFQKTT